MVKVDFAINAGKVKPMNSVNNGPVGSLVRKTGNTKYYEALRVDYARLHDSSFHTNYGGEYAVDVHRVFPDFSADENDPNSYLFAPTDEYLQRIVSVGTKPYYRLGATIEHGHKRGTYPPKDFSKWARICEHIIMHYTQGWANGFTIDIEYWEIWNEFDCADPDGNKPCWQGTVEQFYNFYEIVAKHLKGKFPNLKIGGPAITRPWWGVGDKFLSEMQKRNVPIDFYSFHGYANIVEKYVEIVEMADEQRKAFGYENAELHLNEWNYIRGWDGADWEYSLRTEKGIKGACFAGAVMSELQKTALDVLMYYEARPCGMCGLFDTDFYTPLKTYYTFKAFDEVKQLKESVFSQGDGDVYCIASKNGDKGAIMITRYNDDEVDDREITVDAKNFGDGKKKVDTYLLDCDKDLEIISTEYVDESNFTFTLSAKNHSVYLIKIEKE